MKKSVFLFVSICSLSVASNLVASNCGYKAYNMDDSDYVEKKVYSRSTNAASNMIAAAKFDKDLEDAQTRNNKFTQIMKNSNKPTATKKAPVIGSAEWIAAKNS